MELNEIYKWILETMLNSKFIIFDIEYSIADPYNSNESCLILIHVQSFNSNGH